jgi:hypothetical protein
MTQVAIDLIGEAAEHPLSVLLRIMHSPEAPLNVQAQAAASVLPYCMNRLGPTNGSGDSQDENKSVDELEAELTALGQQVIDNTPRAIEGEAVRVNDQASSP